MATPATVPVFSPDGTLGDIPQEQLMTAVRAGAKPGVTIKSPDGSLGMVPADRVKDAIQAGGQIVPLSDQENQHPGFWHAVGTDLGGMVKGAATTAIGSTPGADLLPKSFRDKYGIRTPLEAGYETFKNAAQQWKNETTAGRSTPYKVVAQAGPVVGLNVPGMEQSAEEGDVAGVAGHAAVPIALTAAGEGVRAASEVPAVQNAAQRVSDAGTKTVRTVARATNTALKEAPGAAGAALGGYLGHLTGIPEGTLSGVIIGREIGKVAGKSLPAIRVPGERFGLPDAVTGGETNLPAETNVVANPEKLIEQPAAAPAPNTSPANVERLLNQATGGKPLQPGVSLRNQASAAAPKTSLPEGFTPVKSQMLSGYKYDPATQHFEVIYNNGARIGRVGITPDQVAAFEDANSKGTAWNILKDSPGVTYTKNGVARATRVANRSASPEDVAPGEEGPASSQAASQPAASPKTASAAAPDDDLTSLLQQSLENANLKKNGYVQTTADPGELSKRWGVDAESLASGREQTRGMSPEETEQYVQKLSDRYKQGFPVEPVMETRDANNNIIEVDGRARAIAAQRAGVKRIPIIVRRMPAKVAQ